MGIFGKASRKPSDFENAQAISSRENETLQFEENTDDTSLSCPSPKEDDFPEGGLQSWLVVFGAWCGLFAALGTTNTIAIFQSYISTHQLSQYSHATIGWVFSVYTFLAYFCGVYIGPLFDKFGPRWLIVAGTLAMTGGFMLLSICRGNDPEYWHFMLVFGVLNGTGCALLNTSCVTAVGHFFHRRRGLATGIATAGGSVGGVVFPLLLQKLISYSTLGWPWAVRILGFLCLALTAMSNIFVRTRLPPAKNNSIHPDVTIFKEKAFLLTTIAIFPMQCALSIAIAYISSYAVSQGFSQKFSFQIVAILNSGSFFGRTLAGWWADHIGPFNANILSVLLSMFTCFAIWLPFGHSEIGIIFHAALIGFASGNNISVSPVCIGKLCPTSHYGRYYATCFTIVSIANLIGNPIAGRILTACEGDFWGLIIFTGTLYTLSLVILVITKGVSVGWKVMTVF
ncbi:Uncharacterized protein HZ326_26666 [Fusarium oxysporum f. sp. albedinis]|nr:Uncharacterized protein HZ326_26666 [Fusarium oxysporum f. sp. albedinis]